MNNAECCKTCKFWQRKFNDVGHCRRYPPRFDLPRYIGLVIDEMPDETIAEALNTASDFASLAKSQRWYVFTQPETLVDDWCGEWHAKND